LYEDRDAIAGISGTPVKPKFPDEVRAFLEGEHQVFSGLLRISEIHTPYGRLLPSSIPEAGQSVR